MLNRNGEAPARNSSSYYLYSLPGPNRTNFCLNEERNLFRKGLSQNLHSSYNNVENMARRLKIVTDSFYDDKKLLKDSIISLKERSDQNNKNLNKIFTPETARLLNELKEHCKEQEKNNNLFQLQMGGISKAFDVTQNEINEIVERLNTVDEIAGIDTNFF